MRRQRLVRACVYWPTGSETTEPFNGPFTSKQLRTEPDSTLLRAPERDMADEGVAQMSISEFDDDYVGDEHDAAHRRQSCVRS